MSTILVVDDSLIDLKRACLLLQKHIPGAEILQAENGSQALQVIATKLPSLIVTDLQMPVMTGLDLVVAIREQYPLIPVVLMTAAGSEDIATEALKKGASSYVPKKHLARDLVPVVNRLLGAAREHSHHVQILGSITHIELVLGNDRNLLADFAHEFRELLQARCLFSDNDCFRVTMALDEALANAYYHGNLEVSSKLREQDPFSFEQLADRRRTEAPYATRQVFVTIRVAQDLTLIVRDEGPGFDQRTLPDPFDPSFVERPCGRGVVLMRAFMDNVQFNDRGNSVTMTKKICRTSGRTGTDASPLHVSDRHCR